MGVCQYILHFYEREVHKSKRLLNNISDIRSVHLKPVLIFLSLIFLLPRAPRQHITTPLLSYFLLIITKQRILLELFTFLSGHCFVELFFREKQTIIK